MSLRRMLPFILINVIVSAAVILAILFWWEQRHPAVEPAAASTPAAAATTVFVPALPAEVNNAPPEEATPAPETNEGPPVYVVQSGDTLGKIATEFDVPVADIMAANGLDNPNVINAGQSLIIPVGGLTTPTAPPPTAAPTQAALPTVTAAFMQGDVNVEIVAVIGVGSLTDEAVFIRNSGSQTVALQGWTLSDPVGRVYTFDQVTLFGGSDELNAGISVHTEAGQDNSTDLYWGLEQAIWHIGDTITLRNPAGVLQAEYTIPAP